VQSAELLQQGRQLAAENLRLRNLLGMQQKTAVKSIVGEILYDARDPFTRKVVLNRGSQQNVTLGQPVIDDLGVVGQITRIFPFTAEVTLLTDKDQAIPVQVLRNGLRSIAYGRGQSGALDLRFMAANADIQKGDLLVTSGIDGVYPAGLAVATVAQVETKSSDAFAHIVCTPVAGVDRHKQLLILLVDTSLPPRPPPEVPPGKNEKSGKAAPEARDKAGEPVAKGGEKAAEKSADTTAPKPDVKPDAKPAAKPAASATPSSPPKVAR
jgi:rod shape-determining protein MreC